MTQTDRTSPESLDRLRAEFGRAVVGAARGRERRRRTVALTTAAVASAGVVLALALPFGSGPAGSLGVTPAEAAVQKLTRSLAKGVLVREATASQLRPFQEPTRETDWTNLATRDRRTRIVSPSRDTEFWNPSAEERFTLDRGLRAQDGRLVVQYAKKDGSQNISSSASPVEEVAELLELARSGELTLRREGSEVVLERRQECFATPDRGTAECGREDGARWPEGAPTGFEPVIHYQTWWLSEGEEPRILRLENGSIAAGTTVRVPQYRIAYERWEVLPATKQNLALVEPTIDPASFLVLEGESARRDALREGRIVCRVRSCN